MTALCFTLTGCEYTTSGSLSPNNEDSNAEAAKPADRELGYDIDFDNTSLKDSLADDRGEPVYVPPTIEPPKPGDDEDIEDTEDIEDNEEVEDTENSEDSEDSKEAEEHESTEEEESIECLPCEGDFAIHSDADMELLFGCSMIRGDLEIHGSEVSSVPAIECLEEVRGDLTISETGIQTFRTPFPSLFAIDGDLVVTKNDKMRHFNGMSSLEEVGGNFEVSSNVKLDTIEGMDELSFVGMHLDITDNPSLEAAFVNGDDASKETVDLAVTGAVSIDRNAELYDLDGLKRLSTVGGNFSATFNQALCSDEAQRVADGAQVRGSIRILDNDPSCK